MCVARDFLNFVILIALFAPYYEKTALMMLNMLKCTVDSDARVAGAEALTSIIIFAKSQGVEYLRNVWGVVFNAFM